MKRKHCFKIISARNQLVLCASNEIDYKNWVQVLSNVIRKRESLRGEEANEFEGVSKIECSR